MKCQPIPPQIDSKSSAGPGGTSPAPPERDGTDKTIPATREAEEEDRSMRAGKTPSCSIGPRRVSRNCSVDSRAVSRRARMLRDDNGRADIQIERILEKRKFCYQRVRLETPPLS